MILLTDLDGPHAGRLIATSRVEVVLGRDPRCEVPFEESKVLVVSARHARIYFEDGWYHLVDLDSKNQTLVNGVPLRGVHSLRRGDVIQLGHSGGPRVEVDFEYETLPEEPLPPLRDPLHTLMWILAAVGLVGLVVAGWVAFSG